MTKEYFEVQHQYVETGKWYRFAGETFKTQKEARKFADGKRNEEYGTRVLKIISEVVEVLPAVPGKKVPPTILPGIGRVTFGK